MPENVLKKEEKVAIALRSLYKKYGYMPYKMSKFEPYDLYATNKDFLVGDGIITFNDTDGKLLALKPDVTLSIIKNGTDEEVKQKVFYNENVYRISPESKQFKELMQVGIECIGEIGTYDVYETLFLAVKSLEEISDSFVLDVSHLGIIDGVLEEIGADEKFNASVLKLLAEKNEHELIALCKTRAVPEEKAQKLIFFTKAYGESRVVLQDLENICGTEKSKNALIELKGLFALLKASGYEDKVRLDFSVVSDRKYYNGIVFKGFVDGAYKSVLSGGRYDKLVKRMHRKAGAIGFAVYVDLLQDLSKEKSLFDVDVLILRDDNTDVFKLSKEVEKRITSGETVRVEKEKGKIRFKTLLDMRGIEQC